VAVSHTVEHWEYSERRACGLVGIGRSTARYLPVRSGDQELRERLRQLAGERRRFGYRRLHVMLRREGEHVNHKRVYRLYREEGLSVRKRGRKRVSRAERLSPLAPSAPKQCWSLDFVSDGLAWGRKIRMLTIVDAYTRESLAIEVDTSLPGVRVARVLDRVISERGAKPAEITLDNGPSSPAGRSTSGPMSGESACASSSPASLSRTPTSRASTAACATSALTNTGSSPSLTLARPSKNGGQTTTKDALTAPSGTSRH
jgi:transposase InsO family protein